LQTDSTNEMARGVPGEKQGLSGFDAISRFSMKLSRHLNQSNFLGSRTCLLQTHQADNRERV
jgi:hypothetical protein